MTCRYAESDGAYVLGALSATARLEFERHLGGCAQCSRSVSQMAGLPGLLSRVDATVLGDLPVVEPVPHAVLASLVGEVGRVRRRRALILRAATAATAAAVAAVIALALPPLLGDSSAPAAAPAAPVFPVGRAMATVGDAPVRAHLELESVTWGTRLSLACTYDPDAAWSSRPHSVTYTMFVRTKDGHTEQVGTWRSLEGRTMHLTAATAASRKDIASVEVRTVDGQSVLELAG